MAKKYNRIIEAVYQTPWSILPSKLQEILAFLSTKEGRALAVKVDAEDLAPAVYDAGAAAIARHNTRTSDAAWDGPANEARVLSGQDKEYYHRIYAWEDPEGDPEVKATYKFIHHEISGEGNPGSANLRACQTGIAVLNGARGGTTIPAADKRGVWAHLAAHIRAAGLEPPELNGGPSAAAFPVSRENLGAFQRVGSVAVVPVFGTIFPRSNLMTEFSGGVSAEKMAALLNDLAMDKEISAIVLDINSPGGAVTGVPELAAEIRRLREEKPITAVVNGLAASAAFWIASQANEIVAIPSGMAGHIGVFLAHEDHSAELEKEGVKVTLISAGKFKTEGNPFEPLSDDARAEMQRVVEKFHDMFVDDVAQGRGVSRTKALNDFGQGRLLVADEAKAAGMIDRIATMNATLARLLRRTDRQRGARAEVTTIREFEAFLRDEGGFSHADSKKIACQGWKADEAPRDGEAEASLKEAVQTLKGLASSLQGLIQKPEGEKQ